MSLSARPRSFPSDGSSPPPVPSKLFGMPVKRQRTFWPATSPAIGATSMTKTAWLTMLP